jgi:hypothetical protein
MNVSVDVLHEISLESSGNFISETGGWRDMTVLLWFYFTVFVKIMPET